MSWGRVLVVVSLATAAVVAAAGPEGVSAAPAQAPPDGYTNPGVIGTSPFVLKDGDTYYQYVDGMAFGRIPIVESTDLDTWAWPDAQSALNATSYSWAQADPAKFTGPSVAHIPANPDTAQDYVLYFTAAHKGGPGHPVGQRCIGVATSASPSGPFVEYAPPGQTPQPLICPDNGGSPTITAEAKDPSPAPIAGALLDRMLIYQVTGASPGVYARKLLPSGLAVDPAAPASRIFTAPDRPAAGQNLWRDGVVERPTIAIGPDGQAWLFFSGQEAATGRQAVGAVKCVTFIGLAPCVPYQSGLPLGVHPANGGRWFGSSDQVANPGRAHVFSDGNQSWVAYQASPASDCAGTTCANTRTYVDKVCFAVNRPRTNAPTTGAQARTPSAPCEQDVAADWQATAGQHLHNVGAWGQLDIPSPGATLRQVVHTTSGGTAVRVRITNRVGTEPLRIDQATVAVSSQRQGAASTVAGPIKALTFGGRAAVQVPVGSEVVSDAIRFDPPIPSGHDLAVSLFVPQHSGPADIWIVGNETSFQAAGNQVGAASLTNPTSTPASIGVAAVDLLTPNPQGTVVVLADSITDGYGDAPLLDTADDTNPDTTANWTDVLYGRLAAGGRAQTGVVNEGLVGDMLGPASSLESGLERLDRDVLAQTGIRTMIVELGNNDVRGRPGLTADQLTSEFQALARHAHDAGVRVVGMTIPPIWFPTGSGGSCTYAGTTLNQAQETLRTTVNNRMIDGTIPFDAVVRLDQVYGAKPPGDPRQFDLAMVGDDCVHPGELGRSSIAGAVDLNAI